MPGLRSLLSVIFDSVVQFGVSEVEICFWIGGFIFYVYSKNIYKDLLGNLNAFSLSWSAIKGRNFEIFMSVPYMWVTI